MIIDIDSFFLKGSNTFFEFRYIFNSALKFNKAIAFHLIDGMISIELTDAISHSLIIGKSNFIDNNMKLDNIFHPFLIDISGITISRRNFFYYPSYSQPIANFFIKNLAFISLNPSENIQFNTYHNDLSAYHKVLCDRIKNTMFHRYKETFLIAYPQMDENLLEYHTFRLLPFSGIKFGINILDNNLDELNELIYHKYILNQNSVITENLILERNNIVKLRYN